MPLDRHCGMAFAILLTACPCYAGETVTLEFQGGRSVTAEIDARTDRQLLWLRTSEASIVFRRSVPWERIVSASHAGRTISVDELRQAAEDWKSELPAAELEPKRQEKPSKRPKCRGALPHLPSPPLRSLSIDAWLAHSRGSNADGLYIQVCPLDVLGGMAVLRGTLEVEIQAHQPGAVDWGSAAASVGSSVINLEPEHFGPSGAIYHVPYRRRNPDLDSTLAPKGIVRARLKAPGEGVFEAWSEVRLRRYSALRDQMELSGQSRFLPAERIDW